MPTSRPARRIPVLVIVAALATAGILGGRWMGRRAAETPNSVAAPVWRPLARLGVEAGDDAGTLGLVADVVADGRGRVYVLDVANRRIAVFSHGGRLVQTLGGEGHGPGELQVPIALAIDGRDRLYVLDPGNARLEVYDASGERAARTGSLPLDVAATDLCTLGDRLFVLGARGGRLIHEVSTETGRVIRSLAPDTEPGGEVMAGARASGYLACGPGDALTFLPSTRGEVIQFSATTGEPGGRLLLPGYRAVRVTERADGAVVFQAPDGGPTDNGSSIAILPDGRQLVQTGVARGGGLVVQFGTVRSYLLSWVEGSVTAPSDEYPRIMSARAGRAYTAETEPFPSVQVIELAAPAVARR